MLNQTQVNTRSSVPVGAQEKGVEGSSVEGSRTRALKEQLGHNIEYYGALITTSSFGETQQLFESDSSFVYFWVVPIQSSVLYINCSLYNL